MMQPVYLNAPGVRRVTLQGPALRVHSRGEADRFLPLTRLARVVCRGPIQWSTAALLHCLQAGVPVTFLDRDGHLLGMCFGAWPQPSPLSELLDVFFTFDDGPQRLVDWFRSHSRSRMLRLLRRHRLKKMEDLRVRTVRRCLRAIWRERYPLAGDEPVTAMKPLAAAQAGEILTSYRIDPALLEPGHDWAGLTCYLTGIVEWELWDLALSGHLTEAVLHPRTRAACYQRHARHLESSMRDIIARLWRWLEQSGTYLP